MVRLPVLVTLSISLLAKGLRIPLSQVSESGLSVRTIDVSKNQHILPLKNTNDNFYTAVIQLDGYDTVVHMDTGSSDLWIKNPTFQSSQVTQINIDEFYGQGNASGPLSFTQMTFAGLSIPRQSFVRADKVFDMDGILNAGATGLIGLGFPRLSEIAKALARVPNALRRDSLSPLENIFAANTTLPRFFSLLLGRLEDPNSEADGFFTIGEYIDGLSNISTTQKLTGPTPDNWLVFVDSLRADGGEAPLNSTQPGALPGKAVALLDSGASFAQVPPSIVTYIYSSIPGAVSVNDIPALGVEWLIPCDHSISLTFTIGGRVFPVHPLDLTRVVPLSKAGENLTYCANSFGSTSGNTNGFDMILGDVFLRNVYTSFNYGLVDDNGQITSQPFVQMLPLTDTDKARTEFSTVRQKQLQENPVKYTPIELRALLMGKGVPTTTATVSTETETSSSSFPLSSSESTTTTATPSPALLESSQTEGEEKKSAAAGQSALSMPLLLLAVVLGSFAV